MEIGYVRNVVINYYLKYKMLELCIMNEIYFCCIRCGSGNKNLYRKHCGRCENEYAAFLCFVVATLGILALPVLIIMIVIG